MNKMFNVNDVSGQCGEAVDYAGKFLPYAHKKLGFNKPVGVNFVSDPENAKNPLGNTAYYDPNKMEITIFVDKRHVKDILRSLSHELVHHTQNCRGEFDKQVDTSAGYAQKDPHMRKMEAEAYLLGNGFLFRDWEDHLKLQENKTMAKINEKHDCAVHEGTPHEVWEQEQLAMNEEPLEEEDVLSEEEEEEVSEKLGPEVGKHKGRSVRQLGSTKGPDPHPAYDTEQAKRARQGKGKLRVEPEKKKTKTNENWIKKNKDELLFERLVKKWAK